MTTLTNEFHNTEITIKADLGQTVAITTVRRIAKALCGCRGCECSGKTGVRGGEFGLNANGPEAETTYTVVERKDCY